MWKLSVIGATSSLLRPGAEEGTPSRRQGVTRRGETMR